MQQKGNSKKVVREPTSSESAAAYEEAQRLLKDLKEGYVPYDMIFTSLEKVGTSFSSIVSGEILDFAGYEFYWKKASGEALLFYGKNEAKEELKGLGLIEICRFRVPEPWIGVGRCRIAWPNKGKNKDEDLWLIGLYLYSTNVNDFYRLLSNQNANTAFMAALFLDGENADIFNHLAERRFDSLK